MTVLRAPGDLRPRVTGRPGRALRPLCQAILTGGVRWAGRAPAPLAPTSWRPLARLRGGGGGAVPTVSTVPTASTRADRRRPAVAAPLPRRQPSSAGTDGGAPVPVATLASVVDLVRVLDALEGSTAERVLPVEASA